MERACWDPAITSVACAGCVLPEISMPSCYAPHGREGKCILVGFAAGQAADGIARLHANEGLEEALRQQLAGMFGAEAASLLVDYKVMDWTAGHLTLTLT